MPVRSIASLFLAVFLGLAGCASLEPRPSSPALARCTGRLPPLPFPLAPQPLPPQSCAGDACAPPPGCLDDSGELLPRETDDVLLLEQAVPLLEVAEHWQQAAEQVQSSLDKVERRHGVIGEEHLRLSRGFAWMSRVHRELRALVKSAAEEPDAYEEQMKLDAASARLAALVLTQRILTLRLNFLLLADLAEDIKVARPHWVGPLLRVQMETDVVLASLDGFQPEQMERAATIQAPVMAELEAFVPQWHATLLRTAETGRKVTLAVDMVTVALAAYSGFAALGARGGGTALAVRVPVLAAAGGPAVAAGRTVVISAEVLESIRRLVELGALSGVLLWAGAGPVAKGVELVPQGQSMMRSAGGSGTAGQAGPRGGSSGPGQWTKVQERFGPKGARYQQQRTGRRPGEAYVVRGQDGRPVRYDGFHPRPPKLIEAKGPGYLRFIENGEFKEWFRGGPQMISQARRQLEAANGIKLEWHVAERELAELLKKFFEGDALLRQIKVIHAPLLP